MRLLASIPRIGGSFRTTIGRALPHATPHAPKIDRVFKALLDDDHGRGLIDRGGIAVFELPRFAAEQVQTGEERWLKFSVEGEREKKPPSRRLNASRSG